VTALGFLLAIPLLGGIVLALVGHRDNARDLNVAFSAGTFLAACVLTGEVIAAGPMRLWGQNFYIDALNVFLVTLTAFVGLTTSIFSRPYMRIERDHGKMTPPRLRLYHSMYQLFNFTMLLALTTNNLGIVWVAMEAATLSTVLLVSVCCGRTSTRSRRSSIRTSSRWPGPSCSSATAPRWASSPCTTGCPTRMPRAPLRCPRCFPGCC